MSTNFPTGLDTFPAASALHAQALGSTPHSQLHANLGDAVAALEAKLGVNSSAVTATIDYLIHHITETLLALTDVTTANATTSKHGFCPKGDNSAVHYLNGQLNWVTAGTVTSVGLSLPSFFTVSNSPVTGSGTLTAIIPAQVQNTFLGGPDFGSGVPSFRVITLNDLGPFTASGLIGRGSAGGTGHAEEITLGSGLSMTGTALDTTTVTVAKGGTNRTSLTAYAVLCGGTTTTSAVQSVASVGTSGQVLTSNGAGALPTFQAAGAGGGGSSPLTTKGDIWVYASADDRLAVGSDGQVLKADSGATPGLSWLTLATVATSGSYGDLSGTPTIPASGGSNKYVQYNDGSGGFSGASGFQYDGSQITITASGVIAISITVSSGGRAIVASDATNSVQLANGSYAVDATAGSIHFLGTSGNTLEWQNNASSPGDTVNPMGWALVNVAGTLYKLALYT